jgi:hypothetical protein
VVYPEYSPDNSVQSQFKKKSWSSLDVLRKSPELEFEYTQNKRTGIFTPQDGTHRMQIMYSVFSGFIRAIQVEKESQVSLATLR